MAKMVMKTNAALFHLRGWQISSLGVLNSWVTSPQCNGNESSAPLILETAEKQVWSSEECDASYSKIYHHLTWLRRTEKKDKDWDQKSTHFFNQNDN